MLLRKPVAALTDVAEFDAHRAVAKRHRPAEEHVENHTAAPHIACRAVAAGPEHLGCHVVWIATLAPQPLPPRAHRLHIYTLAQPEVADL